MGTAEGHPVDIWWRYKKECFSSWSRCWVPLQFCPTTVPTCLWGCQLTRYSVGWEQCSFTRRMVIGIPFSMLQGPWCQQSSAMCREKNPGLWKVLRLLTGSPFLHHWDWPPTLVGTSEDEGFGWQIKDGSRHLSILHSKRRSNRARMTLTPLHQARHPSGTEEGHFEQNTQWPLRHRQVQSISQVFCVVARTISTDSVHGRVLCNLWEKEKSQTWTIKQFSWLPVAESWNGLVQLVWSAVATGDRLLLSQHWAEPRTSGRLRCHSHNPVRAPALSKRYGICKPYTDS